MTRKTELLATLRKVSQQLAHSCELIEEGPLPTDEIEELASLIATTEREPEPKVLAEGWWRGTGKHREFRLIKPPSTVGWKFTYLVAAPEREEE
jgi:hypothetical protein